MIHMAHPHNSVSDRDTPRVLVISYHFPPVGGAGVQRPVKFVKYLREFGWECTVLMAENPSVPVFDESLCRDIPPDLAIVKARTWEPSYAAKQQLAASNGDQSAARPTILSRVARSAKGFVRSAAGLLLQPDPQVLWSPNAYRAASRLLRETPHHVILATAPPYSNLLLGCALKRRFGLPLVADFRDEWDMSSQYLENSHRDWFSTRVQGYMQRTVLREADAIIATTRRSTDRLAERCRAVGGQARTACIYNGYDECDFIRQTSDTAPSAESTNELIGSGADVDTFRLVYTGTLWNLTSIEPLVQAIEMLHAERSGLVTRLTLHCMGRKTPAQRDLLQRLAHTNCTVVDRDYGTHSEAVETMWSADALCVLLSDVPGAERVVPAKLFEYLATEKPLLTIVPPGETAEIAGEFDGHSVCPPHDVRRIADWLRDRLQTFVAGRSPKARSESPGTSSAVSRYSRRTGTAQLAQLLSSVTDRSSGS